MLQQGLSKNEIINNRNQIETLFNQGSKLVEFPILMYYLRNESHELGYPQVFFTVPKKNMRKAVQRNLLKRRMKEAYRINKKLLYGSEGIRGLEIAFLFIGREAATFSEIQEKIIVLLERLANPDEKAVQ